MDTLNDKDGSIAPIDDGPGPGEDKDNQVQLVNAGVESPLKTESGDLPRRPPPPPPPRHFNYRRPNFLMVVVPGFSTENPVLLTNPRITSSMYVITFKYRPDRLLGETGSIDNLNDIVQELLDFVLRSPGQIGVSLSNLSIGFMTADLGGILVKRALVRAAIDSKYRLISIKTLLLIFFGTPHQSSSMFTWEEVTLRIIDDTYRGLRGPWLPDRIHQLSRHLELIRQNSVRIIDRLRVINYYQDLPESTSEVVTVHRSCARLQGYNVTNIRVNATHYELHCFVSESPAEDFIIDRIADALRYPNKDFCQFVEWLSLEADGMETSFQSVGLDVLADTIICWEEVKPLIQDDETPLISLEIEAEIGGKQLLSCLNRAIQSALPQYPGAVVACTSITITEPSSLTETGLLSCCLIQILKQRPRLSNWLSTTSERILYALQISNIELRVRTLWECLRRVFARPSHSQGFWLIDATEAPDQSLILRVVERLGFLAGLDAIPWKVIIISNSESHIDFPSPNPISRITLSEDTLMEPLETDIKLQLFGSDFKEPALQFLRQYRTNYKLVDTYLDVLSLTFPPIQQVLYKLAEAFTSTDAAFRTIFERIPQHCHDLVRTVLSFVCFSRRPMTSVELAVAVAAVDCQNLEQLEKNIDYGVAEYIQWLLPGIIRYHEGKVHVLRGELLSFLSHSPEDAWYHIGDCHLKIAMTCYNYLSLLLDKYSDVVPSPMESKVAWARYSRVVPGDARQGQQKDGVLGFILYAAMYWYDHCVSAKNNETSDSQSVPWLTEPLRLKEMLALRRCSRFQLGRELEPCAPEEFMPLHLRENIGIDEYDALRMTVQLIDGEPSDAYIDLMYPLVRTYHPLYSPSLMDVPVSLANAVARNWIISNFQQLSLPEVIIRYPQVLHRLFQTEKKTVLDNASGFMRSIIRHNIPHLLLYCLKEIGNEVNLQEILPEALRYAVFWGLVDITRILFTFPETQLSLRTESEVLLLLDKAISTGSEPLVQLLLDSGAGDTLRGMKSPLVGDFGPLHVACQLGSFAIVRLLLDAGIDINLTAWNNSTALHIASSLGFPMICELLLERGAVFTLDADGDTPLHCAARFSKVSRCKRTVTVLLEALKKRFPRYLESDSQDAKELSTIINAQSRIKKKTALSSLAVTGDINVVKSLIDLGADVDSVDKEGYSALSVAAIMGDVDMVRCLLDNGAKIDLTRSDGRQVLHDACAWGDEKVIEELLDRNASVDHLDEDELPPISVAAMWGLLRTIRQMIPRSSKKSISLALISAARYGYYDIVVALLDAGADVNQQDESGSTALQFACDKSNSRVTQLLLTRRPDLNIKDNDGCVAVVDAVRGASFECLKMLLDAGADFEAADSDGQTPLAHAAESRDPRCFKLLLERGAQPVVPKNEDETNCSIPRSRFSFLGWLAYDCAVDTVKIYLEHLKPRISEDVFSSEVTEALAMATYEPQLETMRVLLEHGADPNVMVSKLDIKYATSIGIAIANDHVDAVRVLLDNKATPVDLNKVDDYRDTPLHLVLDRYMLEVQEEIVDMLLDHGADATISSGTYGTVLNATCGTVDEEIVKKILNQPGVSRDIADDLGRLPIHLAAGNPARIDLLSTETSTVRSLDKQGRNALHCAAAGGWLFTVEKILKDCPDLINVPDHDGWTPLHWACRQDDTKIAKCLFSYGADKEARTNDGWMPRHVALYHCMSDHLDILPCEEDDASDDEELPNLSAEEVTNSLCDSCFCEIYGVGHRCDTCPKYWLCFKCHWHHEETHPKHHVFHQVGKYTNVIYTPTSSRSEAGD